ncbi:TlpA family protein disulfide reductase [Taibaiella koreensis]|uniref:TlpA family protein disulfide reductase n=1 Tax=Taibaiella koreensis TaxID=1268548 RepID=UPI000E59EC09|nr:TlpA disulfide reductase family protein [Taibaiella koreensis]
MKKLMAALLPGLIAAFAANAQKPVTITGTITEPADSKVIIVNGSATSINAENKQETLELSKEGKFQISVPVTQKYNWIVIANGNGRLDLFVKEGSTLNFTTRGPGFISEARFEGKDADIPRYFVGWSQRNGGVMSYFHKLQETAQRDPATYQQAADSLRNEETARLKTALDSKQVPKDFFEYLSRFFEYSVYDAMLHYPVMHEAFRLQTNNIQSVPPELYAVTRKTPKLFNDDYLDIAFYQNYAQSYYSAMLAANGYINAISTDPATGQMDISQAFRQTDSTLQLLYKNTPRKTGEFAAGRILLNETKGWPTDSLLARIKLYKQQYPKSANNKVLDKMVADLQKFDPGHPALDFAFKTLDGKDMKLSDLKGKVVYLDFWASWCGPCKGEMPHAKKIKEHFQGKDVVFLYVSIDDKEDAWKKGIETLGISGVHTRTPGWKGDISALYEIGSVPSYFLIDRKGNFAVAKTPRPSQSEELVKLIEGLL